MAVLAARGEMGEQDVYKAHSMIGSTFYARIHSRTEIAGVPAIVPAITGGGWITGTKQLMLDPDDPWPGGYKLADTWPGA